MSGTATYTLIASTLNAALDNANTFVGASFDTFQPSGLDVSADPNNPRYPQFVNTIKVSFDQTIYFTAEGKGFMAQPDMPSLALVVKSLPSGVQSFLYGAMATGQSPSGQTVDYLMIVTENSGFYYCFSLPNKFAFGAWNRLIPTSSSPLARAPVITNLVSIDGVMLALCGRFTDADGAYYGMCSAALTNILSWSVFPASKLSTVMGNKSFVRNICTDASGDLWMYGRIFDNRGANLLAVNIAGGAPSYDLASYIAPNGVDEMIDLVHTARGKLGLVVPTGTAALSLLGCSAGPGPVGANKAIVFWNEQTMQWFRLNDAADNVSKLALRDFGVLSSNIATDYQGSAFVIGYRCSFVGDPELFAISLQPGNTPSEVGITIFPLIMPDIDPTTKMLIPIRKSMLQPFKRDSKDIYPILVSGVNPTAASKGGNAAGKTTQMVEWWKNPWVWFGAVTLVVLIFVWVGSIIIGNIGSQRAEQAKIAQQLGQLLQAPTPAASSPAAAAVPSTAAAAATFGK